MSATVTLGDCVKVLAERKGRLFDACVTDPPYHLSSVVKRFAKTGGADRQVPKKHHQYHRLSRGFMGKTWDGGDVAMRPETWAAVYDQLKPGAHLIAFGGTRTFHRIVCAIEDAGFEIRDTLFWAYGSGFPKSHDVSKRIDKLAGHWRGRAGKVTIAEQVAKGTEYERTPKGDPITAAAAAWEGWGTALKPALEPICLARKPLSEKSVAANVLRWGTGALNIDGCRIEGEGNKTFNRADGDRDREHYRTGTTFGGAIPSDLGRWPANLLHDGSDEVLAAFPDSDGMQGDVRGTEPSSVTDEIFGKFNGRVPAAARNDSGSAARFFFSAKAGPLDRLGSAHPTVKPVDLMRWLCRLVTPPNGLILDPFAGSGSTGIAALAEGFSCEMIDLEADHVADIERKLAIVAGEGRHMLCELNERKAARVTEPLPLFGGAAA